jgi:L-ascorbate metabolism protein UlaG (beta-lactamase superfamily)
MQIIYHGHSAVQLNTNGKSLIIDPFLSGNEQAVTKPEDVQVNTVLLTHAHQDHILDAAPIAKANAAPVVANFELAAYMSWQGVQTIPMNLGGTVDLGFAQAKMVPAIHTSGIIDNDNQTIIYGGLAAGYIIRAEGLTILHVGDTALFSDMKLIGEQENIDLAFIPIGDHFTMGPDEALQAAEWYRAKLVVPVHYNTFQPIRQDAEAFVQKLAARGIAGKVMAPGDKLDLHK